MRILIILFTVLLSCLTGFGQPVLPKTEIIIIGTIHSGNSNFNHKTLYNVLMSIKPDIILNEDSENYNRVFGLKTATFLKIAKPGIEQLALQTFSKRNKNILILPFDTSFSRRAYIKNFERFKQAFYDSLYSINKSIPDSLVYADFAFKYNSYHNFIDTSTLQRINQKDIIDKSRELYSLEEKVLLPLAKKYIPNSLVVSDFENNIQFWNSRNAYMVNKIVHYSKQYSGKRIVILTGLNHKYFLKDKLNALNENGFKLLEFWNE